MSPTNNRIDFSPLAKAERLRILVLEEARAARKGQRLFFDMYPDEDAAWQGPAILGGAIQPGQILYARRKYPKHMEWFAAGVKYRERCFMGANRVGKTFGLGGYEAACHLTGLYPGWWIGRRFNHPVSAWAAGDTYETTRDILQLTLLGEITTAKEGRKGFDGRGVIPGHMLGRNTWRSGVQDLVDTIAIRHVGSDGVYDGNSILQFKSSDQGRRAFQGTARHVVWLDEECPADVYGECLIRTATVDGIVMLTFTPLLGMSEVVMSFMPADQRPDLGR